MNLMFKQESFAIRGACFEVYKDKGCGFLEDVYQECLEIEFEDQKIPYVAQPTLELATEGKFSDKLINLTSFAVEKLSLRSKRQKTSMTHTEPNSTTT